MSAQHTPGPWRVDWDEREGIVMGPEDIVAVDGTHVVCFGHDYDQYGGIGARHFGDLIPGATEDWCAEINANARLIAAAPDLLATAKAFLAQWQKVLPAIAAATVMQAIHGARYDGPTINQEIAALEGAVARAEARQ